MSQKFSLYADLTVFENLRFFAGMYGVPAAELRGRIDWALEMAGLRGRESSLTGTLSGGWKQRLALGCAVLHRPPIVFLDEPTSGVDPLSRRLFWELIQRMSGDGVTIFVTTHYMDEAEYCNRLALMNGGKLIALGTPTELKLGSIQGCVAAARMRAAGRRHRTRAPLRRRSRRRRLRQRAAPRRIRRCRCARDSRRARGRRDLRRRPATIRPSLEDAFVALTTRRGADAAAELSP